MSRRLTTKRNVTHSYQGRAHRRRQSPTGRLKAQLAAARALADVLTRQVRDLESELAASRRLHDASSRARLSTLLTIAAALLTTHEVEAILDVVVREAPKLFPGTTGALVFLADFDTQQVVLRATNKGSLPNFILSPGQGVAGRAFLAPRAMLMVGPELEMALSELDDAKIAQMKELLTPWPPTSALLAPLRIESLRLGAFVLYGGTHAHLFLPRDLPFVQTLADLVAVAIAEIRQRDRAVALQRDLTQTQSLHAEAQARLDSAQAQLLQSAKLAAVGELAASVAHEINNPLYAARNSLYLVEQDLPPDAPERSFLAIAQGELGRIARIITRMRDFYRPTRAELDPIDINNIVAETIDLVQTHLRHGNVSINADLAPALPVIVAHADQLRQVLLNLMLNACDAMPEGGLLAISTSLQPDKNECGMLLKIDISDTGVGISSQHMPHLFEPFYTTKPQGTGLGLAISAHIITQHGGQISVDSAVGKGTTFTIMLPTETFAPSSPSDDLAPQSAGS